MPAHLANSPDAVELPERFSVFGATRISSSRVKIVAVLAQHRDVHLWLHHASPTMWDAVNKTEAAPGRRREDTTATATKHPLLMSMSRDVRELQLLLNQAAPGHADTHHQVTDRMPTLLGRLQQDLANDTLPDGTTEIDGTFQVHACHGKARQVEVVREVVLGLLAKDPTLEPRDVLIMCPDIEAFAPLVAATFGMVEETDGHPAAGLRVRLADRSLRQTNPLLSLLSQLLELAGSRVTATRLLDLAGAAPVRQRSGFSDADIERLRDWAAASSTRWGLDSQHRKPYGLDAVATGTWRAGIDRLLVGAVMEEDEQWLGGRALPHDDVNSGDIDLAGAS